MTTELDLVPHITDLLRKHKTLRLATAGGVVSPWIAGAYFAERGVFTLQVILEAHGKTMKNVLADDRVAVMVADNAPYSLFAQGEGRARIVEGEAAEKAKADLLAKNPEMAPFFSFPLVHVNLEISRWLLTDVPNGWIPAKELRPST
ncbi:pyridoxamine 5'-phosphate oxidase family protein [Myxococcota bacterium]|nr:pyridoxamine 5'-phosphate oxidase family protein [Myxococcota bacterium]